MNDREFFINSIFKEMLNTIDSLYITCNSCTKNILLNSLRKNISDLSVLLQGAQNDVQKNNTANAPDIISSPNKSFTQAELSRYNGKNGNPAYVAVNGTVYDVTNNAAWAAATHFGLTAGRDVTREFASCHSGQPILSRLKAVGKIVT
jgi:predicted heme/steroid binding protein